MITIEAFRALNLSDYAQREAIWPLGERELYCKDLAGEAAGPVRFVWRTAVPRFICEIELGFDHASAGVCHQLLGLIGLKLTGGMNLAELMQVLGPPGETHTIASDGFLYVYRAGEPAEFLIICQVWKDFRGLVKVTVRDQSAG
jgi:hypothetical protein